MRDMAELGSPEAAIAGYHGVDEETLLGLVKAVGGSLSGRIEKCELIDSESRNPIYRVTLSDSGSFGSPSIIAKTYLKERDPFFDHRFRREEKILSLLNRWYAQAVPTIYGGCLAEGHYAVLLLEDLGDMSFDKRLHLVKPEEKVALLKQAIDCLVDFQEVTSAKGHFIAFYRTCYSIDLDRLTITTYLERLAIALRRILSAKPLIDRPAEAVRAPDTLPTLDTLMNHHRWRGLRRIYASEVAKVLTQPPKFIVHNSFSPLNLILHQGRVKIIDFETMALGPPQIDLAELLKYPACDLTPDVVEELIDYYLARSKLGSDFGSRDKFTRVFDCANLSRGLDYTGTVSWRYLTSIKAGDFERAQEYLSKRQWYLDDLRRVLAKFDRLEDMLSILA